MSSVNSSTIQQAGLTNLRDVVRVRFNLSSLGYVVVPKTDNVLEPNTRTARDLLLGLRSLSKAPEFNIYMRQSDYAIAGLQTLN